MTYPGERELIKPFILPDNRGRVIDVEKFRQLRNLVLLVMSSSEDIPPLLRELVTVAAELETEEAVVLPIVHGLRETAAGVHRSIHAPFAVLSDAEGAVVGALCPGRTSLYVTDRFREVFMVRHDDMPTAREVLAWLAHINRQCPE